MDILGKLLGSPARVKILRLFLLNPLEAHDLATVASKTKVSEADARKEINLLKSIGLLGDKSFFKKVGSKSKRVKGVALKNTFPFLASLKNLVISETPLNRDEVNRRLRPVGKIKYLAIAGIFLGDDDSRVDLLIVGDGLKKRSIEAVLRSIEAEIGKELSYGVLETAEFLYRVSAYDKFVRDVLDFKHDTIIDKLGVE